MEDHLLQPYSLEKVPEMEWIDLVSVGLEARLLKDKSQWILGFLSNQITTKYGEQSLKKYAEEIRADYKSLIVYRWVVRKHSLSATTLTTMTQDRFLPFKAYQISAGTENPQAWIAKAEEENWTATRLGKEIKKICQPQNPCNHEYATIERCIHCYHIKTDEDNS